MLGVFGALIVEVLGLSNWYDAPLWAVNGGTATWFGLPIPFNVATILGVEVVAMAAAEAARGNEPDAEKRKYPGGAFDPLGFSKDAKARSPISPFPHLHAFLFALFPTCILFRVFPTCMLSYLLFPTCVLSCLLFPHLHALLFAFSPLACSPICFSPVAYSPMCFFPTCMLSYLLFPCACSSFAFSPLACSPVHFFPLALVWLKQSSLGLALCHTVMLAGRDVTQMCC
eukprot:jgi/Botrbrau1/67/Bobra.0022s0060.2